MTQKINDPNLTRLLASVNQERIHKYKKQKYCHAMGLLCLLACITAAQHFTTTQLAEPDVVYLNKYKMDESTVSPASIPGVQVSASHNIPSAISQLESISIPSRPLNQLVTIIDDQDFLALIKQNGGGWISGHGRKYLFVRSILSQ